VNSCVHQDDLSRFVARLIFLLIIMIALFLRVYRLDQIPYGVDYDESANLILAREIAEGQTPPPIFVKAYAGREGVFFWLAALSMRLFGRTLFALRLTSAWCGMLAIVYAYALARELFGDCSPWLREGVPLFGAALMAGSYWLVHVNRYGFRVNTMPPLMTATMFYLWRGLRQNRWTELAFAGLLCGLSANTYLAIRAFPLLLGAFAIWTIARWGSPGLRVRQWALWGFCALIALAPLGWFFIQNPEFFSIRMSQASIFDPEIHQGHLPGALAQATLKMFGDFTIRGDEDPIYNLPGKPIFDLPIGLAFYLGLLVSIGQILPARKRRSSLLPTSSFLLPPYFLLLLWLPIMMLPNILGARGIPHHLRGMGMSPAVFYLAALGLAWALQTAQRWLKWLSPRWAIPTLSAIVVSVGAVTTWRQYADVWAVSDGAYYRGSASLRRAAEYLGRQNAEEISLWVSNSSYRHTTFAANCANYAHLKWFSGQTLVFPADDRPALYSFDFTNPLDPVLARYMPQDALVYRDRGPDGGIGFEVYRLPVERRPVLRPQHETEINLGNTLVLFGYDLNSRPASGQMLDVTLYWRILRDTTQPDWTFFVELTDELGFGWGGETFFNYPSAQWRAGETLLVHKQIAIAPGAPPGAYMLVAGVFSPSLDMRLPLLNAAGQMAGTAAQIGPIQIARASAPPQKLPPIQHRTEQTWLEHSARLSLLGYDLERTSLRPGERIILSLYWQTGSVIKENCQVMIGLHRGDDSISLWQDAPAHASYPFSQWLPGEFVRDRYALRLPTDLPPGNYQLRLGLTCGEKDVLLGEIQVPATDRLWTPPAFAHPVGAKLGDSVQLLGYNLDRTEVVPGETIHLTLIWQCLKEMDVAYTVFIHLLDANQQMRGQKDNPPRNGSYPTTLWVAGEIIVDEYDITVKPDTLPGVHVIEVGMYDLANLQRLSAFDPLGTMTDHILLGEVKVKP